MDKAEKYFEEGNALYKEGKYEEAIAAYDKAIGINSFSVAAWCNKGNALSSLGKYEEAVVAYDKAIGINSFSVAAWGSKGNALSDLGKYEEAIAAYEKAIDINPEDPMAWYNKGVALEKLNKYEEAFAAYDKATYYKDDYLSAWNNKGNVLLKLGRDEDAIDVYDKVIATYDKEAKPDKRNYIKAWHNKGVALNNLGDYKGAIAAYYNVIDNNPNDSGAWSNIGVALYNLGNYEEAIEAYYNVIDNNPEDSGALNNKGNALCRLGKYDEAITAYDEAININNRDSKLQFNNPKVWFNKGNALAELNRNEEAALSFVEAKTPVLDILVKYPSGQGERIAEIMLKKESDSFFTDTIKNDQEHKESYTKIYIQSLKIIQLLHIKTGDDEYERGFAHYTSKQTSQFLIFDNSKLWLSSITTSNDPKEGQTFLDYLWGQTGLILNKNDEEYRAFTGCFTFNHNCLNQFRLYGKEEGKECTGISLVVKNGFFKKEIKLAIQTTSEVFDGGKSQKQKDDLKKHALFRCLYLEPKSGHIASIGHRDHHTFFMGKDNNQQAGIKLKKYKEYIDDVLKDVRKEVKKLRTEINKIRPDKEQKIIISKLLINLRYLTKHVAFREEQECRIIQIESIKNVKNNKERKIEIDNDKLYIDYIPVSKYVDKVFFGPRAEGMELYRDRLLYEGLNIKCERSDHPFAL